MWPTLDAFASKGTHQLVRYMTWNNDPDAVATNALDYYWDPITWFFPRPSHSSSIGEGLTAADHGNSDLSRVDRSNMVASAGQTANINGSNPSARSSGLPQVSQGEY